MNLKDAITLAASVSPRVSTLPVLSCVSLNADGNTLRAVGTNLQVGISTACEYQSTPFNACVDAEKLKKAIASMPEPTLVLDNNRLVVKQGKTRAAIPVVPFDLHPGLPKEEAEKQIEIPGELIAMVEKVVFATAKNDVRPYLSGVCLQSDGKGVVAVATDGHRLAMCKSNAELPEFSIIIPASGLKAITASRPEVLKIGRSLYASSGSVVSMSKLIDHRYPDIGRLIPTHKNSMTVDTAELRKAVASVQPFAQEKSPGCSLVWDMGVLKVSTSNGTGAESSTEIDCDMNESFEIGLNINYLSDALSLVKGEKVTIEYTERNQAIRIDEGDTTQIIMPMKL